MWRDSARALRCTSASTIPRPRPRLPPVTIAVFPCNETSLAMVSSETIGRDEWANRLGALQPRDQAPGALPQLTVDEAWRDARHPVQLVRLARPNLERPALQRLDGGGDEDVGGHQLEVALRHVGGHLCLHQS